MSKKNGHASSAHLSGISPLQLVLFKRNGAVDLTQKEPPFKLCHGANHELWVTAPDGSSWIAQRLGLRWMGSAGDSPDNYGLSVEPRFVADNGDGEAGYQVLLSSKKRQQGQKKEPGDVTKWHVVAKLGDDVKSGDVKVALSSYWQAPKYLIDASVGHFRYGITELKWDRVVPIVESGNSTTLTATVKSPFDESHAQQGVMVVWDLGGTEYKRVPTDANGESKLVYKPTAEEVEDSNRLVFKATCLDALQQPSEREQTIHAFRNSPWLEELTLKLREQDDEVTDLTGFTKDKMLTVLTMRLKRRGQYKLIIKPKRDDSLFMGQPITLGWQEGSRQLGIEFSPEAAQEMTEKGLTWDITGGTESGVFDLEMKVPVLELPFQLPGVQMSASLADEAELTHDAGSEIIFHRGVDTAVRIVPKAGSPLGQLRLPATLHFDVIDTRFPESQAPSNPPYREKTDGVTESGVEWTLTPPVTGNGGRFGLRVEMPGFTTALELPQALALFSELDKEAQVFIDDSNTPIGNETLVLRRNTPLTIKLKPQSHSGLGGSGLKGWITFASEQLEQGQVPAEPDYGEMKDMTTEGLSWTLEGGNVSGNLSLAIHAQGFARPMELAKVVLISEKPEDELQLFLDNSEIFTSKLRITMAPHFFQVYPKNGSPLADKVYACRMVQVSGVSASPVYERWRALHRTSGLGWTLFATSAPVDFNVEFEIEDPSDGLNYAG